MPNKIIGQKHRLLLFIVSILAAAALGAPPQIEEVGFYGNKSIPDWELSGLIETHKKPWFALSASGYRLNELVLKQDLSAIESFYRRRGFLDASAKANVVLNHTKKTAFVDIFIDEGARYLLRQIVFDGDSGAHFVAIEGKLAAKESEPFNSSLIGGDKRTIQIEGENMGYPYCKVDARWERCDSAGVSLTYTVSLGKVGYFGDVEYRGVQVSREFILRRELAFKRGDRYSFDALLTSQQRLYQTGLFKLVDVAPAETEDKPETLDVVVSVFERKPRWTSAKLSLNTDRTYDMTADVTAEWGHRNLFGSGYRLALRGISQFELIRNWDNLKNRFEVEFTEPRGFALNMPIELKLYFEPGNRSQTESYRLQLFGGQLSAEYKPKKGRRHIFSTSYERMDIYGLEDTTLIDEIRGTHDIVRKIGYTYERDTRDNVISPQSGALFNASDIFAGSILGGDEHYDRLEVVWSRYIPLHGKYIYASRFMGGFVGSLKEGFAVEPHNRFYLGGANTLRGFSERSLGERDEQNNPIGGNFYFLMNLEMRIPIIWKLYGQLFYDMGNLWDDIEAVRVDDIKGSAGAGVSLLTPVGPLRFDYGFQVVNPEYPGAKRWHLALLYAF